MDEGPGDREDQCENMKHTHVHAQRPYEHERVSEHLLANKSHILPPLSSYLTSSLCHALTFIHEITPGCQSRDQKREKTI